MAAAITASRGAVRMPLPARSTASTKLVEAAEPTPSRPSLVTADRPYPTVQTIFGRRQRSAR